MGLRTPAESLDAGICRLRRARVADAAQLKDAVDRSIEHLRPWMPWISMEPTSLEDREALLERWEAAWDAGTEYQYVVSVDDRVVGACGLMTRVGPGALEIGYWVSADMARRGIATAAAGAMTHTGIVLPGIDTIVIFHDAANLASRRVPEKLGYARRSETIREPEAPAETGVLVRWEFT